MFQYRFFTHWMVVIPSWLVSAPCRDDARSTHAVPLGMTFLHFSPLKVFSDLFRIIVDGFDGLWIECDLEPFGAMGAEDTLGLSPSRIRGSKFEQWQSKRKSDPQLWRQRSLFVIRLCQTLGTFWHSSCREVDSCDLARILVLFHNVFIKYRHNKTFIHTIYVDI